MSRRTTTLTSTLSATLSKLLSLSENSKAIDFVVRAVMTHMHLVHSCRLVRSFSMLDILRVEPPGKCNCRFPYDNGLTKGLMFLKMWGLFTAALAKGSSATRVSIINTSANFMVCSSHDLHQHNSNEAIVTMASSRRPWAGWSSPNLFLRSGGPGLSYWLQAAP